MIRMTPCRFAQPCFTTAIATVAAIMAAAPAAAAKAPPPPRAGCVAVSKIEYDSAMKKKAPQRFGAYVRTRKLWRRYYWYCPL